MLDPNALTLESLFAHLTADGSLDRLAAEACREDVGGRGDVTTRSIVADERRGTGVLAAREAGVVAGLRAVPAMLRAFGGGGGGAGGGAGGIVFEPSAEDGACCGAGEVLGRLVGPIGAMLTAERAVLNLVGRLCGIATLTRRFVDAVAGTRAVICETRKTTPGLRGLEKYAVRCGGGTLHRLGLWDAALYKDNHLAMLAAGDLAAGLERAIRVARAGGGGDLRFVQVEVDTLEQLACVLGLPVGLVDAVLLDNMRVERLREAVALRDRTAPSILLEASGGVTLGAVRVIAETGVDRISVGALTHAAPALDVGLDVLGAGAGAGAGGSATVPAPAPTPTPGPKDARP